MVVTDFEGSERPETVPRIIAINKVVGEQPEFKTEMIQDAPYNQSENSSNNEEHKQVETYIPNALLQPHWPQSEAHEHDNNNDNDNKIECLGLLSCRVHNHI